QPFAYSSRVVWAWVWCALRRRLAVRGAARPPRTTARPELPRWLASAALPLLLVSFSYTASALHLPALYRSGPTRKLVQAIGQQLERSDTGLIVAGARASVQVPQMFCCASGSKR